MFQDKKTKSVADAVAKIMNEELKGKQHKIDANKNNKVDAEDFKILRGKKKTNEEVEQIDELSKSTLGSYIKKAASSVAKHSHKAGEMGYNDAGDKEYNKASKRLQGTNMAVKKLTKESEQIDEVKLSDLPVRKVSGKAYGGEKQAYEPETDEDDEDMPKKKVKKGTFKRRYNTKAYKESFADMIYNYDEKGLKYIAEMFIVEEPTNDEYTAEVKDAQAKSEGKDKKAEVAKPAVQAVKNESVELDERHLTSAETKKKEEVVKAMKKNLSGFRERYGKRAKNVMYATATSVAKKK
jgi:hypothetical protein